jgi:hypothetical protein
MRGGEKQHTSSRTILTMDNRTSLGMIVIYVTVAGIDICHGQILYTSHIISSLICYYAISIAAFSCVNINVKSLKTAMVAVASVLSSRNDISIGSKFDYKIFNSRLDRFDNDDENFDESDVKQTDKKSSYNSRVGTRSLGRIS